MITKEVSAIRLLLPLLKPYRLVVVLIIISGVIAALAEGIGIGLLIPLLQSGHSNPVKSENKMFALLNQLLENFSDEQKILAITLMMLGVILIKMGLSYLYSSLCVWLTQDLEHNYRRLVFEQCLAVSPIFLDKQSSGQVTNILSNETRQMGLAVASLLWASIGFCTLLVFSCLLLLIAWHLTLVVVIALLLVVKIVHWLMAARSKRISQQCTQAANQLGHYSLGALTGLRTIHAFGQEDKESHRYQDFSERFCQLSTQRLRMVLLADPLTEGFAAMVLVGFMFVAFQGLLSLPVLITIIFMLYRLQPHIKRTTRHLSNITASTASITSVLDFIQSDDKPYTPSGELKPTILHQAIHFEHVSFNYDNSGTMALSDLNVTIPKGKMTAIIGSSGAGKSTLASLILRFYEPTAGKIYTDKLPITEVDLKQWRSHIALVSQDVHIFNDSLWENIAYGSPIVDHQAVVQAAKQAHLDEFIRQLPDAYDTVVGERGMKLSGGQRQRLAIARAIMRNADILILDEATNSLDTLSEALIQQSIDELRQNHTLIVIAHRLSTVEHADNIVVLDKGKLVEQGTRDELLALKGYFSSFYLSKVGYPE